MPPLSEYFDWGANSWTSEMVLDGNYSEGELEALEQLLLQHCRRESEEVIPNEIAEVEFRERINTWDERTTTSPLRSTPWSRKSPDHTDFAFLR